MAMISREDSPFNNVPSNREERWQLLEREILRWTGESANGYSSNSFDNLESVHSLSMPKAIKEWYCRFGKREDIWNLQDFLQKPNEISIDDKHLTFIVENQSCTQWTIKLDDFQLEDPPVYVEMMDANGDWRQEAESFSLFMLKWFIYCWKWNDKNFWTCGYLSEESIIELWKHFPEFSLPEMPCTGSRFYGFKDILIEIEITDHIYVSCLNEADYRAVYAQLMNLGFEENASWENH